MKILGLCGRKQSGKNTVANFIAGTELVSLQIIDTYAISSDGQLIVPSLNPDFVEGQSPESERVINGILDLNFDNRDLHRYLAENVWPHIKLYSFADPLKKSICLDVLGLYYEQCFGTDEDKNSLTEYKWKDMPEIRSYQKSRNLTNEELDRYMTAREVMQYVGTQVFRRINPNIWANATIQKILRENSSFAIITDCRFPNEIDAVHNAGGKVIRLTRSVDQDTADSETATDISKYDWSNFDAIIKNDNLSITETNAQVLQYLKDWKYIEYEVSV